MNILVILLLPLLALCENSTETTLADSTTTTSNETTTCSTNSCTFETTTSATETVTTSLPVSFRPKFLPPKKSVAETCSCNLQRQFCDINCCCDLDCSSEDKEIFSECSDESNFRQDTSFCNYMEYGYINQTPYKWEVNQNGFFCIVRTNYPTRYTVQVNEPIQTLEDAELQKRNKFSWSNSKEEEEILSETNESYVLGSELWMIRNNRIGLLALPDSFVTNACLMKKNVNFLKNTKTRCIQTQLNDDLDPSYYLNVSILSNPEGFNVSKYEGRFHDCPKNVCLPVETRICKDDFGNCHNFSSKMDLTQCPTCFMAVQKARFIFYHNGTRGIKRFELNLILKNLTSVQNHQFVQEFEVVFLWLNSTMTNHSLLLSGNPGYLVGKPLLIGNVVNFFKTTNSTDGKNHTENLTKLERNWKFFSENFMVLPMNKMGICVLNNSTYLPLEFGYNLMSKCKVLSKVPVNNRNETCGDIQKQIYGFWPILQGNLSAVNRVVGIFGNANVSVLSDWVDILMDKSPLQLLNSTFGNWTDKNETLYCSNLVTVLKISIFHSRVNFKNLNNQEKILGVTYEFVKEEKKAMFRVDKDKIKVELAIREEVVFYDMTKKKERKFVDPPKFTISLPYDFYYPFVKVGNGAVTFTLSFYSVLVFVSSFTFF